MSRPTISLVAKCSALLLAIAGIVSLNNSWAVVTHDGTAPSAFASSDKVGLEDIKTLMPTLDNDKATVPILDNDKATTPILDTDKATTPILSTSSSF